jgi:GntR family transcriptional regulator, transcriptional repressor for pyruvate dehydrogenase complex
MIHQHLFKKVQLQSIPEQISKEIKTAILEGKFKPGQALPTLKQLSEQFGVSHPTIREALQILIDSKLLKSIQGRRGGFIINEFNSLDFIHDVHDLLNLQLTFQTIRQDHLIQLREIIEIPAVGLAAIHRTEEDLMEIENCLSNIDLEKHTVEEVLNADFQFHILLAKSTKNPLIYMFMSAIVMTFKDNPIEFERKHKKAIIEGLPEIIKAIKDQNPEEAKKAMKNHLYYSINMYRGK